MRLLFQKTVFLGKNRKSTTLRQAGRRAKHRRVRNDEQAWMDESLTVMNTWVVVLGSIYLRAQSVTWLKVLALFQHERGADKGSGVTDAKGLARQLQQVHCSAYSCLKENINSMNQW
jgi:hypothetical protein